MNRLELVTLPGEDHHPRPTQRRLTIGVGDISYGCAVAAQVFERRLFSSIHVLAEQIELWETTIGKPRLTRENPFLGSTQRSHLDERGLIREGTRVAAGDVLASIVEADRRSGMKGQKHPEQGMQWVTDSTRRVPDGWEDSFVASVRRLQRQDLGRLAPRGLWEQIEIVLRAERPLQIGDVLVVADRPLVVSSLIGEPVHDNQGLAADIVVSPKVARELGISPQRFLPLDVAKSADRAADVLQARNVGAYSLITQTPLGKLNGGQLVTLAHVGWLQEHGLSALAGELASLKSDDLVDRPLLKLLVDEPHGSVLDVRRPAAPLSLAELAAYLTALGLHVDLESGDGHVSVRITPATADEIVKRSAGPITRPETLDYRTYEDVEDGLFAPNIFGPSDWSRRERFGHFKLAVPIVPILWRLGEPSLVSRATGLCRQDIERIVTHQADVLWHDDTALLIDHSPESRSPGDNYLGTGAAAIRAMLARKSAGDVPAEVRNVFASLTTDVLAVLPPDWRPLVLLDSGNFATSDLNDLYRRVINRSNRLKKLIELQAPQVILDNESRELQQSVDSLYANDLLSEGGAVLGDDGRRLVDILLLVFGKIERQDKRVDWSGAARLTCGGMVPPEQVLVPRQMFETLRLSEDLPLLMTLRNADGRFLARLPRPHDEPVLRVSLSTYDRLVEAEAFAPVAQVHRPVTAAGRHEARRLLLEELPSIRPVDRGHARSWLQSESVAELVTNLVRTACSGESIPLASPRGLLIGGTGSTQFPPDAEVRTPGRERRQVPIPPEEQPRFSEPTFDQMAAVARSHARRACVFDVRRSEQVPPAPQGRVGGEPFLPPAIEWPYLFGKPLPFLGQFPLDPARDAGVLPFDVPPNSMLTVFGGSDCWEPGPCHPRCPVLIHSINNLTARAVPTDLEYPIDLCEITPRIVEETPDWAELQDILIWELGNPKRELLREFCEKHWPNLPLSTEGIKIGGWPKWIQNPDTSRPLVLQITSESEADFIFGDSGTLYVFVEENGDFTCFTQCC